MVPLARWCMVTCQCALSVRSAAVDRPLTVAAGVSETAGSAAAQSLSTFQNLASSSLSTWPASEISRVLATEVVVQSLQQVVQHGQRLGPGDEGPFVVVDVAEQAAVAGALAVVRAPAPGDDLAGADQDLPEFFLVGEPVQVPGAAGEGVVQDEELAVASGFLVGHGRGDDREVVGVAAVLLRHAGHQRRRERRDPLVDQGGGDGEQDPDRLGVQHVGEDQLGVVAGSGAASLRAPEPVVAGLAVAGTDQRVGVAGSGRLVRGRAAARDAGEELPDPGVLPGEPVGRLAGPAAGPPG